MDTLLDFEKPIAELEAKLQDMRILADQNNVDVSSAVNALEAQIAQLKENTFKKY